MPSTVGTQQDTWTIRSSKCQLRWQCPSPSGGLHEQHVSCSTVFLMLKHHPYCHSIIAIAPWSTACFGLPALSLVLYAPSRRAVELTSSWEEKTNIYSPSDRPKKWLCPSLTEAKVRDNLQECRSSPNTLLSTKSHFSMNNNLPMAARSGDCSSINLLPSLCSSNESTCSWGRITYS